MKDKRCFICKYQGKNQTQTATSQIYGNRDKHLNILLCYAHSVELFKMGQRSFMSKHRTDVSQFFGTEDDSQTLDYFSLRS